MDMLAKKSMKQIESKLFLIPFAFILLRMWGTLQFFFSIIVFHGGPSLVDKKTGCVPDSVFYTYKVLALFQVGDKINLHMCMHKIASLCFLNDSMFLL